MKKAIFWYCFYLPNINICFAMNRISMEVPSVLSRIYLSAKHSRLTAEMPSSDRQAKRRWPSGFLGEVTFFNVILFLCICAIFIFIFFCIFIFICICICIWCHPLIDRQREDGGADSWEMSLSYHMSCFLYYVIWYVFCICNFLCLCICIT